MEPSDEPEPGAPESDEPDWLVQRGLFEVVVGIEEAVDLLSHPCLHADLAGLFTAAGAGSGVAGELLSSSLLSINGDEHKRLRSVVAPDFTPRAVERTRPHNRSVAEELAGGLAGAPEGDFIRSFDAPYVTRTTCEFVGLPLEEIAPLGGALDLISWAVRDLGRRADRWDEGIAVLADYATSALAERRARPRDDVLSRIARSVEMGHLSELVGVSLVVTLLSAGQEPTTFQLGLMVDVLAEHEQMWDALAAGEVPIAEALEETLRYRSTNQGVDRRIAAQFEYHGVIFEEDRRLLFDFALANHDHRRFGDPDHLSIEENARPHLAFGFGPHFCLGAALARVQLQEALQALTRRFVRPHVVDARWVDGGALAGPESLTVKWAPRSP